MVSRRNFLKTMGMTTAGLALGANDLLFPAAARAAGNRNKGKVKIAYIGIGNRGEQIINEFARTGMVEVVALCDVDLDGKQAQKVQAMYPGAKKFRDFRQLFEKAGNEFEAVAVATPDHSHFPIAMLALSYGKHVYLEKPMCRTFHEAELLMEAARKHPGVVTQVGNQGHSEANYFQFKAWMDAGIIKDVTAITAHMNNERRWHKWDAAGIYRMPEGEPVPAGMDWDTWLCARPYHEFNPKYHQGDWRCWYDFGMGALGDWGAHILDTAHEFLQLGLPYEINMLRADGHNDYFYPYSSTILFRFPSRGSMPPVDVTWYDGIDNLPPLPAEGCLQRTRGRQCRQISTQGKSSTAETLPSRAEATAARFPSYLTKRPGRWPASSRKYRKARQTTSRISSSPARASRRRALLSGYTDL